jgi:hypothetical protein
MAGRRADANTVSYRMASTGDGEMAHFHFNLRSLIASPAARDAAWRRSLDELPAVDEAEFVKGPGWFDSSWDLVHGLEVREGLPGDAQLHEWLEVWLRDERVAPVVPRPARPLAAPQRAPAPAPARDERFDAFDIDGLELA